MIELKPCLTCVAPGELATQSAAHVELAERLQVEAEAGASVPEWVDSEVAAASILKAMLARDLHEIITRGYEKAARQPCPPVLHRRCGRLACLVVSGEEMRRRIASPFRPEAAAQDRGEQTERDEPGSPG